MEQTWRWFGEQDPIPLDHIRQAGATGVVSALHHIPVGQIWPAEEIAKLKALINASGLTWSVCESIPVEDCIKRCDSNARRAIDTWKDNLVALGRAGVPVVCYNFMPVVDWTRTDLNYRLPSGGFALRFDLIDFIAYDVFMLKRKDAEANYSPELFERARERIEEKSESERAVLEKNIIAGLPGGADARTRKSISALIDSFVGLDAETMRGFLIDFLREVVPVAEEVGVRLGLHPDDPPFSLFGLPRVISGAADAQKILGAVDSEANGLTFCAGSYGSRKDNNLSAMVQEFASRINFAHLRNVVVEDDGSFFESDHLVGQANMVSIIEILLKEERRARAEGRRGSIPFRPDHGHLLADDIDKQTNPGYSYIGRLKGLAELRGVLSAVDARLS